MSWVKSNLLPLFPVPVFVAYVQLGEKTEEGVMVCAIVGRRGP